MVAVRTLVAEHGYQATTQRQITAAADVSSSALFHHFKSKSQLFVAAVIEPFGELVDRLISALETSEAGGLPHGPAFVSELYEHLSTHRGNLRVLLTTLQSVDGTALMDEVGRRLDPLFRDILDRTVAGSSSGSGPATEEELTLRLVFGTVTTLIVLDEWLLPEPSGRDRPRLIEVLGNMSSRGGSRLPEPAGAVPARPGETPPGGAAARCDPEPSRDRRRNPDEVRRALLAAASELFIRDGYAATSYADIANGARTSQSALYRHFGSKSNLLLEAALEPFADAVSSASLQWVGVAPGARRRRQPEIIAGLCATFAEHRELLRILMAVANDPAHGDVNRAVSGWFTRLFSELQLQLNAQVSPAHSYEPDLRLRAAMATIVAATVLDDWFMPQGDDRPPASRIVAVISRMVTLGRREPA